MNRKNTENNNKKKPDQSLETRVFRQILIGSFLLGLALLVIFLGIYGQSLASQYITESFSIAKSTRMMIYQLNVDTEPLFDDVIEVYESLPKVSDKRSKTSEYTDHFHEITTREDYVDLYNVILRQGEDFPEADVYVGFFDSVNNKLVYICDPDEAGRVDFEPGCYDSVEAREINKFVNWDGTGKLFDISYMEEYGWMCTSGVPVYFKGNYAGFVFGDVLLTDVVKGVLRIAARYIIGLLIATLAISFIVSYRMRRYFVTPINNIAKAAGQFASDRQNNVAKTNHFESLEVGNIDEINNLRQVMSDMEKNLVEYEDNITRITSERERIRTELDLAARIQEDALPAIDIFKDRTEFDLYAYMRPAKGIGGDFYDFFLVDDDHLCLVIADVSGKGIPASLFMMASKIVIADYAKSGRSPAEILESANRVITHDNEEKMFVTAWVGILELSTGKLRAANAGHEYPALMNENGVFEIYKDKHGFILGGLDEVKYTEYEIDMKSGQSLFVYTDGVAEGSDKAGDMFGTERIIEALNKDTAASSSVILNNVSGALDEFCTGAEQFDDVTMLTLKYLGSTKKAYETTLPAHEDQLDEATAFFDQIMEEHGASLKSKTQVDIVIDEIFSNIVRYGYPDTEGTVTLKAEVDNGVLKMIFMDHGIPFNPLNSDSPDITLGAEEREVGGLGIFIVKKTMDSMDYRYEDNMNILIINKKL